MKDVEKNKPRVRDLKHKDFPQDSPKKHSSGQPIQKCLQKNYLGWKIFIGLICLIGLAVFLHFRETKIEILQLHSTAGRYVVAQVDFEFPDEEATIIFRQDALRDIGTIYRIDTKQLRQVRFDFENYLIQNQNWRKESSSVSYETIYQTADAFESILAQARFTNAKTIKKMKDMGVSTEHYLAFKAPSEDKGPIVLPQTYWKYVKDISFEKMLSEKIKNVPKEILDYVIDFFENQQWQLIQDFSSQKSIQSATETNIPETYSKVKAGTKIISQGEKVTARHLAMMSSMKESLNKSRNLLAPLTIFGNLLVSFIVVALSGWYLYVAHGEIYRSVSKLALIVCIFLLTLVFAKLVEFILIKNSNNLLDFIHYPLLVPFAAILFSVLLNARISLYGSALLSILLAITLAVDHNRFLVINFLIALIVIVTAHSLRRRKEVFGVCAKGILGAIPIVFAFSFVFNELWSMAIVTDLASVVVFMLVIAILVVGLLPILESLFNVMTDITLMEYMDPNNELLRRLTLEIPGTYQHSLVLGNLAEAAAQSIGANALLCKVGTLYHDIGKLNNTRYFTENQQGGVNIHQLLTPVESAQVIVSHVKDGEILAKKYRLPQSFIDLILQHHGTTLVYYFYCKEVEIKGGNVDEVDESLFRYPGPKPRSKEAAIVMLCDAIEAASRSLDELTEDTLVEVVDRVVADKVEDGQLDECCLTFEELGMVKKTIIKTIMVTRHVRVKYPKKAKN